MTKQFGPLVKARNVPEPRHNEYRVTSRHAQTACAVVFLKTASRKSDKSEGFKTNAVVSVFFLF